MGRKKNSNKFSILGVLICICAILILGLGLVSYMTNDNINKPGAQSSSLSNVSITNVPYFNNQREDVLLNVYTEPTKHDEVLVRSSLSSGLQIPINQPTQSVDAEYRQVGILKKNDDMDIVLPLIGRPVMYHRDKWQYYTLNKQNVKIPISHNGRSSTSAPGCYSLSNGDDVQLSGHQNQFQVELYDHHAPRYIPVI